ncbi:cysteine-rich KTR domain-containing protein [Enterococcus faecalis]
MCPVCGNKTRLKIREDTELKKIPPSIVRNADKKI